MMGRRSDGVQASQLFLAVIDMLQFVTLVSDLLRSWECGDLQPAATSYTRILFTKGY